MVRRVTEGRDHLTRNVRWVSLLTLLSRCLGLARDALMAARFGNGLLLDSFTVAFRLPNLARALLGEGALATAFLPAYVQEREQAGRDAAQRLAVAVVLWLTIAAAVLVVLGELLLWGFAAAVTLSPESDLLRRLMMWLLPYLGLICIAAQLGALLNAEHRFLIPALVPSILNSVWLLGLWTAVWWTTAEEQLFVMCAAVLVAGVLQVLVPMWGLRRLGFRYDSGWPQATAAVLTLAGQLVPALGGLLVTQMNVLLDSLIAWGFAAPVGTDGTGYPLVTGTASALYFGQRLYQFPLGVFGVALGTVLFPLLAQHAQARQYEGLRTDFAHGLRYVAAIGVPASAGLMLIAHPLASLCFEYGAFSADDARATAQMIAAYGSGVWAYCGLQIIHRGFFAIGDRMTPLRVSGIAVALNLLLNLSLIWVVGGVALALTTSLVSGLQCVVVAALFRRKIGNWDTRSVRSAIVAAVLASVVMIAGGAIAAYAVSEWSGWFGRLARVAIPLGTAIIIYLAVCRVIGFQEPWELLHRRGRKSEQAD